MEMKFCVRVSNSDGQTYSTDGLPLKIDNFEHFPAEILLPIFIQTDDIGLLNLALVSTRFESIVREVFAQRYAEKYFVIEGESEVHRDKYSALFGLLGNSIRAIEANGIRHIDNDHWLVQLLNNHTPNLEKMCFKKCFFRNNDDFWSQHMKITHLTFQGGACEENYRIQLPEYRSLKSLELVNFSHISKPSLEQVVCNNPQIERLILKCCDHYFTLTSIMELIYTYLKHLKELNILDCYEKYGETSLRVSFMDQFVDALTTVESFGMTISNESTRDLLRRVSLACKSIKHLELYNYEYRYYRREWVNRDVVCLFDKIETLSLMSCSLESLVSIVNVQPNLRCLYIFKIEYCPNDLILTILRQCKHLEKLIIESESTCSGWRNEDESTYKKNVDFHDEFIEAIQNPNIKLEFREKGEVIGSVTKKEIIWRKKLLHWIGYDSIHSRSNVRLLDLATDSKGKHKQPLNLILNFLDLDSLYSFCMTSKKSKQLVHNYIQHRCKPPPKKCTKQRAIQRGKFLVTDEFGYEHKGLQMFGKCMKYLEIYQFNYRSMFCTYIGNHCKILKTLCLRTHIKVDPDQSSILPQVRHFIFYGYCTDYTYECDLSYLSQQCSNLEILEIKTVTKLSAKNREKPHSFQKLQKIKFKPFDDSQVKFIQELFKNSDTEVVIDQ